MAAQTLDYCIPVVPEALETGCSMEEVNTKTGEMFDSGSKVGPTAGECDPGSEKRQQQNSVRAEIDTSAPFESVKEAVTRFGGVGFWKPHSHKHSQASAHNDEVVDIAKVGEQAAQLEKDLIMKERETLSVLKELEATKLIVEELKVKIQKEASEVNATLDSNSDDKNVNQAVKVAEKESHDKLTHGGLGLCPSSTPGFILLELKQAKLNLTRTTTDLTDIRATVETFNKKIEKERVSLEKTRQRLASSSSKVSSLEEELNQTKRKLQLAKDDGNPMDISMELQRLTSETEQFKKMGEAAKSEVFRAISEIEQTKSRIKTAEMRLIAAKKMKEAARATEAVALAEIKSLSSSESSCGVFGQNPDGVTLSFEEYSSLTSKAREAEEVSKRREMDAMVQVDEANVSKTEVLKKVEEAMEEVKSSKVVLEEALNRVEAANRGKLAVEEALRKWRSDHGHKRRSVHNSTRFKNSCQSHHRKDSRMLDIDGQNPLNDGSTPVLKSTLSIGQILSRKLLLTEEESNNGIRVGKSKMKRTVSLGQMLSTPNDDIYSSREGDKENGQKKLPAKRKKFGFARISLLVIKQSKKKKKQTASSRLPSC